jgi:hypothetical protein
MKNEKPLSFSSLLLSFPILLFSNFHKIWFFWIVTDWFLVKKNWFELVSLDFVKTNQFLLVFETIFFKSMWCTYRIKIEESCYNNDRTMTGNTTDRRQ